MRLAVSLILALGATPALADYHAIMTDLPEVLKQVYGSADVSKQDENYVRRYNLYILDGIDGVYVPISAIGLVDQSRFKEACSGQPAVKISRHGDYQFTLVENFVGTAVVEYTYTYRLGNTFTFATDPDKLLKSQNLPPDNDRAAPAIAAELFGSSGVSTVMKIADSMLVFQRNFSKPMIYARCD